MRVIVMFFCCIFFTSCFEITEEVKLKKDGSGDFMLTVNFSESKEKLKSYMEMEEFQGYKIPTQDEILAEFDQVKSIIAATSGISNVNNSQDFDHFIFAIAGEFNDIEALNNAINSVAIKMNKTDYPVITGSNYSKKFKEFNRLFPYEIDIAAYKKLPSMARFVLESARFTNIYRFDQPIVEYTNKNARLSPNKTAIMLQNTLGELAQGAESILNDIRF